MRNILWICFFVVGTNLTIGQESRILPLEKYLSKDNNYKLDYIIKVESKDNIITLHGYHNENNSILYKKKVKLDRYDVLQIRQFNSKEHRISLMTIPFKIRPVEDNSIATSGLSNIGVNYNIFSYEISNYFASSRKSHHRFSLGIVAAPGVEELDSTLTSGKITENSKQLFVGMGISINYSYNNITLSFIPLGYDIPMTSLGKSLDYKRWWGFGIGIEPRFFSRTVNN